MSNITIGISDLNVAKTPDILITYALGSCVGICLYDPAVNVSGLSHILLPYTEQIQGNPTPMRFANTAIPMLMQKMQIMGARPTQLKAKIAGGAQMFASSGNTSIANIGARNVAAVKEVLQKLRIPIMAEDTGSNYGRTLLFDASDYSMIIRSPKRNEVKL